MKFSLLSAAALISSASAFGVTVSRSVAFRRVSFLVLVGYLSQYSSFLDVFLIWIFLITSLNIIKHQNYSLL